MPLKSTPCPSGVAGTFARVESAPNLSGEVKQDDNITTRTNKRMRKGSMEHDSRSRPSDFMQEMRQMLSDFKAEQNKKFEELQGSIKEIKENTNDIYKNVLDMSKQYEEMRSKLEHLDVERKNNLAYIQVLQDRVETMERNQRASSIEIRNIPAKPSESKSDLANTVSNVGKIMNMSIQITDIRDIYRVQTKTSNKSIIVDFVSTLTKENFLLSLKQFNNQNRSNKLNTQHLKLDGPPNPIYVSENLTFKARKLFYMARDYAAENNYNYCWTSRGRIYLRKKQGEPYSRIDSEEDLVKLKSKQ